MNNISAHGCISCGDPRCGRGCPICHPHRHGELGRIVYEPDKFSFPRCDCHQCTWLRASQIDSALIPKGEPSR
jgi:hypothetical protein